MGFPAPAATSPWVQEFPDYLGRQVTITFTFDNSTRRITGGSIRRDARCLWHTVVFGDPADPTSPRLSAPGQNAIDVTVTAAQVVAATGFTTVEQAMGVQITAEP
jgi:hypothetical protein